MPFPATALRLALIPKQFVTGVALLGGVAGMALSAAPASHAATPAPQAATVMSAAKSVSPAKSASAVKADDPASAKALAKKLLPDARQFAAFDKIVSHESGWNPHATNAASGAYGLVQALPGSKMASAGADWHENAGTQIKWGIQYMTERYGSPAAAWDFWQAHHWY
ncbi:transglycosylase SLT domain-containing protein [Streptomyces sp. CA-253872]|uniref:aggregation-promoting factor C-terminal-like domain-containing protein n=1 Tax=Streptomyces sp. CA-253872 TaxID=3240067 RepID=UPI003D8E9A2B